MHTAILATISGYVDTAVRNNGLHCVSGTSGDGIVVAQCLSGIVIQCNALPMTRITSLTIVYSTVYLNADQRKHQSSASLAFVRGIHRGPVNSPHKWPVTRKMFPFDDVIKIKLTKDTPELAHKADVWGLSWSVQHMCNVIALSRTSCLNDLAILSRGITIVQSMSRDLVGVLHYVV